MAEQIKLVGDVEQRVEGPMRLRLGAGQLENLIGARGAAIIGAERGIGLRIERRARAFQNVARGDQVRFCRFQILIGGESLPNQAGQDRVVVEFPPAISGGCGGNAAWASAGQGGRSAGRRDRRMIIRPQSAPAERRQADETDDAAP
jgi:hypothetical protein